MYPYFKKYGWLILIVVVLGAIIRVAANSMADPLIKQGTSLQQILFWKETLTIIIIYLINVIIAGVVLGDLLKNNIKALPVFLLTLVSFVPGVILFLFLLNHKISTHEE